EFHRGRSPETNPNARNALISGPFLSLLGRRPKGRTGWLGWEDSNFEMVNSLRDGNWILSPIRAKRPNLFPLKLLSNSKRSYFENRIEWAEYGGSEKSAGFGE